MELNSGSQNLNVQTVTVAGCGTATVNAQTPRTVVVVCTTVVQEFTNSQITIIYTNPGSTLAQTSTGTVSGNPAPDTTPPVLSNINPPNGTDIVVPAVISLVFNTDEPALCEYSIDDGGSYTPCGGVYVLNQQCNNVNVNGPLFNPIKVIISCRDSMNPSNTGEYNIFYNPV